MDQMYLIITNFDHYQHYRERNISSWIKLYYRILDDYKISGLENEERWMFIALLLLAGKMNNQIPLDYQYIGEKISHKNGRGKVKAVIDLLIKKNLLYIVSRDKLKTLNKIPGIPKEQKGKTIDIYRDILKYWNSCEIIIHREVSDKLKGKVDALLKQKYTTTNIMQSIGNYKTIISDTRYFFSYKWTLVDFLQRGFERFLDLDIAKSNFLKGKKAKGNLPAKTGKYKGLGNK